MTSRIPIISVKVSMRQFAAVVRTLRLLMNELIADIAHDDQHEIMLFEHNYYLLRSWIAMTDREQETITLKIDLMYAKAFISYWSLVELPQYENMVVCKIIANLDQGIQQIEAKRKNFQL